MVGLVPLFCTLVLKDSDFVRHPGFAKRTKWFLDNRKDLKKQVWVTVLNFMYRGKTGMGNST